MTGSGKLDPGSSLRGAPGPDPAAFARLLTDYCLEVRAGQQVVVRSTTLAAPLLLALQAEILGRGAWPLLRADLPVPGALLKPAAFLMEMQPLFAPPITRDQIELLKSDNVVADGAHGLSHLGITNPVPVEGIIETYLYRFRRGGGKFEPRFS